MGLVITKAKRETISLCFLGFAILGIIINLSFAFMHGFMSADQFSETAITPYTAFFLSALFIYISIQLKKDNTWFSRIYDRLSAGTLLIILILSGFVISLLGSFLSL